MLPSYRAGNGTRTRDPNLGKVVLYQLSYSRGGRERDAAWRAGVVTTRTDYRLMVLLRSDRVPRRPEWCTTRCRPAPVPARATGLAARVEARGIEPLTS